MVNQPISLHPLSPYSSVSIHPVDPKNSFVIQLAVCADSFSNSLRLEEEAKRVPAFPPLPIFPFNSHDSLKSHPLPPVYCYLSHKYLSANFTSDVRRQARSLSNWLAKTSKETMTGSARNSVEVSHGRGGIHIHIQHKCCDNG